MRKFLIIAAAGVATLISIQASAQSMDQAKAAMEQAITNGPPATAAKAKADAEMTKPPNALPTTEAVRRAAAEMSK
jgi:hypothetical protein